MTEMQYGIVGILTHFWGMILCPPSAQVGILHFAVCLDQGRQVIPGAVC